jgi:hypothetical protein
MRLGGFYDVNELFKLESGISLKDISIGRIEAFRSENAHLVLLGAEWLAWDGRDLYNYDTGVIAWRKKAD